MHFWLLVWYTAILRYVFQNNKWLISQFRFFASSILQKIYVLLFKQIFLKRASFEKNIILLYTTVNIYWNYKKINFKILTNVSLFPKNENNFWTWQPSSVIWSSCYSEIIETVINRFLVPKNLKSQIFRSFQILVWNLRLF